MKFGSTLLFASLFSALTYAQPAANVEALARRNYAAANNNNNNNVVVVTVTKTVYVKANQAVAQPTPATSSSLQPVPHAAQTTYVAPSTTSSSSSVVAATPVETTPAASSDDWRSEMLSRLNEV
ncbi:hypothetical protein H4R99_008584, partial [Coemansia sp. RSA 1722]